jgi:translation initiation factor 1 (eIF-1/SUI1)
VTKTAAGGEEITVQGDVAEDVLDWLVDNHKGIPEENIEITEDKKKKAAPTV